MPDAACGESIRCRRRASSGQQPPRADGAHAVHNQPCTRHAGRKAFKTPPDHDKRGPLVNHTPQMLATGFLLSFHPPEFVFALTQHRLLPLHQLRVLRGCISIEECWHESSSRFGPAPCVCAEHYHSCPTAIFQPIHTLVASTTSITLV